MNFREADGQEENTSLVVIPAKAGIQDYARFRGHPDAGPRLSTG